MDKKYQAEKLKVVSKLAEDLATIKALAYKKHLAEANKAAQLRKEKRGYSLYSHISKLSVSD